MISQFALACEINYTPIQDLPKSTDTSRSSSVGLVIISVLRLKSSYRCLGCLFQAKPQYACSGMQCKGEPTLQLSPK